MAMPVGARLATVPGALSWRRGITVDDMALTPNQLLNNSPLLRSVMIMIWPESLRWLCEVDSAEVL
jgi:hypothetical protein